MDIKAPYLSQECGRDWNDKLGENVAALFRSAASDGVFSKIISELASYEDATSYFLSIAKKLPPEEPSYE